MDERPAPDRAWTFLTNHGHVLVAVKEDPQARLTDLAARIGITERAVQLIVRDLERDGYLIRERSGRRNTYTVTSGRPLRHPAERNSSVDDLLAVFE